MELQGAFGSALPEWGSVGTCESCPGSGALDHTVKIPRAKPTSEPHLCKPLLWPHLPRCLQALPASEAVCTFSHLFVLGPYSTTGPRLLAVIWNTEKPNLAPRSLGQSCGRSFLACTWHPEAPLLSAVLGLCMLLGSGIPMDLV